MKVLVANLGSTSFKYRLFDMQQGKQLARGGIERIGAAESSCFAEFSDERVELTTHIEDHAAAVRQCLEQLTTGRNGHSPCLTDASEVSAIGFKAVHGGRVTGVQRVTEEVLEAMEEMSEVAPAHNPPYINAMRLLSEKLPGIPLVAAFETGFHQTVPDRQRYYGCPLEWAEHGVKRWGFHGASHRYIAERTAELIGRQDIRVISCHLGGSSSLCAIRGGVSAATSMGMSPQSGLPHNNRVGDFDPFALPVLMKATQKSLQELLTDLAENSGLLGLSGVSGDVRDLEQAADEGNERAKLALDFFITEVRRHLGGLLVELGGAEAIVFTGGIGENGKRVRSAICAGLEELGIQLNPAANDEAQGECRIDAPESRTQLWVVPTNEEWIVAKQAQALIEAAA